MSQPTTATRRTATTNYVAIRPKMADAVRCLLPPLTPEADASSSHGALVGSVTSPSATILDNEARWTTFATDPTLVGVRKRAAFRARIRALQMMLRQAREQARPLCDVARETALANRQALERAWVSLLTQNEITIATAVQVDGLFETLENAQSALRNRLHFVDLSPRELATLRGCSALGDYLSRFSDRPDARDARGLVVVPGYVGSPAALDRLNRMTAAHKAVLVSDAPAFPNLSELQDAAAIGEVLEQLSGNETYHRWRLLFGNRGRVRRRFRGAHAEQKSDLFLDTSLQWAALYLRNFVDGRPWLPTVGFCNPLKIFDGNELDLKLTEHDGYYLYLKHRINPLVAMKDQSAMVVVWGASTSSGIQIGHAMVETIVARFSDVLAKRDGLFSKPLDQARRDLEKSLNVFIHTNSGADRMFQTGSSASVRIDHEMKALIITFALVYREVAERVVINITRALENGKNGKNADSLVSISDTN